MRMTAVLIGVIVVLTAWYYVHQPTKGGVRVSFWLTIGATAILAMRRIVVPSGIADVISNVFILSMLASAMVLNLMAVRHRFRRRRRV